MSCFKDDSIFVWDCETMKCVYQLTVPPDKKPGFKCLASTNDCRVLVAGGRYKFLAFLQKCKFLNIKTMFNHSFLFHFRSRFLYIWNLDNRQLIQVIELPDKVKVVKEIDFVTNSMALNQHQVGCNVYFFIKIFPCFTLYLSAIVKEG